MFNFAGFGVRALKIFLVRHGEAAAAWNDAKDPGLSDLGHKQARDTAEALNKCSSTDTAIISSPLARARETAEAFAALRSAPIAIDHRFAEIPSPVSFENRRSWLSTFMKSTWADQPDSLLQWRNEIYQGLNALAEETIVFSHFMVINAAIGLLRNEDKTVCVFPDYTSVTVLEKTEDGLTVQSIGKQLSTIVN